MNSFINIFAIAVCAVSMFWVCYKIMDCVLSCMNSPDWMSRVTAIDKPAHQPLLKTVGVFFHRPYKEFHRKTRSLWSIGYMLYHFGVVFVLLGYIISAFLLASKLLNPDLIPVVCLDCSPVSSLEPVNMLSVIFGNAEPQSAQFLFGNYARLFITLSWFEVIIAALGNLLLIGNVLFPLWKRQVKQKFYQRIVIRSLIGLIIWSEIAGRLFHMPEILQIHIILGLILLLVLPVFYVNHIVLFPFTMLTNLRRLRHGAVA